MKKQVIDAVLQIAKDTEDPIAGVVFEKTVEIDFATFCAFVLTQWDNVSMEESRESGTTVYIFYSETETLAEHVASYNTPYIKQINEQSFQGHGCFGGIRIGSANHWNDTGKSYVKNAFIQKEVSA